MIRFLASLLAALTLLGGAPAIAQDEEDDVGYLTRLLQDNLSAVSRDVRIIGFEGALSSQATIERMTIADEEGVWLEAEDLVLEWNRSALLRRRIDVDALTAERIAVLRAPVPAPNAEVPAAEASLFTLPELPVSVELDELSIGRIEIGEHFIGEPVAVSLAGEAALEGGEGFAEVIARRVDGAEGTFTLAGSFSNATRELAMNLRLSEGENGIVANRLGIPGKPSVRMMIDGAAPIDDYAADIAIATDGEDRVTGTFEIATNRPEGETDTLAPADTTVSLDISGDVTPLIDPSFGDFFGTDVRVAAEGTRRADGSISVPQLEIAAGALQITGDLAIGSDGWPERFALDGKLGNPDERLLLPIAGGTTYVRNGEIFVGYDRAEGDEWSGFAFLEGFEQPGVAIPRVTLFGDGIISPGEGAGLGEARANVTYEFTGLTLDDVGFSEAIGQDIAGALNFVLPPGENPRIEQFTLGTEGMEATATAEFLTDDFFQVDADLQATAGDFGRFSTLTGLDLAGNGLLRIAASVRPLDGIFDLDLRADTEGLSIGNDMVDPLLGDSGSVVLVGGRDESGTRVERFELRTDEVEATASATLTSGVSSARFEARVAEMGLVLPEMVGPGTLTGTLNQDAAEIVDFDIDLQTPAADLAFEGTTQSDDDDFATQLALLADIRNLAAFSELAGRELGGAANLSVQGSVQPLEQHFDLVVDGTTRDLAVDIPQLDPLIGGAGQLSFAAARDALSMRLRDLSLSTPEITATAEAAIGGDTQSARVSARLREVGLILDDLSGPATLNLSADEDTEGFIDIDLVADAPSARIGVDARMAPEDQDYEVTGTATASVASLAPYGPLVGRDLNGSADLDIAGSLQPLKRQFDLTVNGTTGDLAVGIPRLDPLIGGDGMIDLAARYGDTGLDLERLELETDQVSASARAMLASEPRSATITARIEDVGLVLDGVSGPATLDGTAEERGDRTIGVTLGLSAPSARAQLDAVVAPEDQDFRTTGTLSATVSSLSPFAGLAGRPLSGSIALDATGSVMPRTLAFDITADARTADLGIGIPQADQLLRGPGTLAAQVTRNAAGEIRVRSLDASLPNLSVNGALTSTESGQQAEFNARLANIGLFVPELSGPVTAAGTASLAQGGTWSVNGDVSGAGVSAAINGQYGSGGNVALTATGSAPLGLANPFIEPRRLIGNAEFNLGVNGQPSLSALSGTVRVGGARLSLPSLSQSLDGIGGTITLGGGQASLDMRASPPDGGSIAVTGTAGLSAPFNGNITATLGGVVVRDPTLFETVLNGRATINGPLAGGARIAGQIEVGRTEVRVPSSSVGSFGALPEVRHSATPGDVRTTLARAGIAPDGQDLGGGGSGGGSGGGGAGGYPLDITVRAPGRIFIRGRGVDAELGGELRLTGTTNNPIPIGRFDLIRGRIDVLERGFQFEEGSVALEGDFSPYIRLVARTRTNDDIEVSIIVEGGASDPEISFESSPELPQDEVLAHLLFGRDITEITPLQAVQLAQAVATLSGRGGGGLLGGIRDNLGLDDLDLTTDEEGNAAVRAGAYLTENIYTDVVVGANGNTQIDLNLDLTEDITAKGTIGSDGETSLGVFFERDY